MVDGEGEPLVQRVRLEVPLERLGEAAATLESSGATRAIIMLDGMAIARRLTLGPDVTRAAAYHVVDAQFVARHSALSWAAHIGPIVGLDIDESGQKELEKFKKGGVDPLGNTLATRALFIASKTKA